MGTQSGAAPPRSSAPAQHAERRGADPVREFVTGELQRIAPGDKRHFGTRIAFAGEQNEGESGGVSRVKPFQKGDEKGGEKVRREGKSGRGAPS